MFKDPKTLYTALQEYQQCQDTTSALEDKVDEFTQLITNKDKEISLLNEQIVLLGKKEEAMSKVIDSQDKAIENFQNLIEAQKKGYEAVLQAQKPSLWHTIKEDGFFVGVGIVLGKLLIFL